MAVSNVLAILKPCSVDFLKTVSSSHEQKAVTKMAFYLPVIPGPVPSLSSTKASKRVFAIHLNLVLYGAPCASLKSQGLWKRAVLPIRQLHLRLLGR